MAKINNLLPPVQTGSSGGGGAGGDMFTLLEIYKNTDIAGGSAEKTYVLRMPREVSDVFSADWQQQELGADFLNRLIMRAMGNQGPGLLNMGTVGDATTEVLEGIGLDGSVRAGEQKAGVAKNKINTLLFKNANIRQFQLSWDFMPVNSQFAQQIEEFITTMREKMHPEISEGGYGYATPSLFQAKILVKSKVIFASSRCALTNLTVNPFGSGLPSFHEDGHPVHSSVTLEFQEIIPNTASKIKELYKA
jgi:hypothetical protein